MSTIESPPAAALIEDEGIARILAHGVEPHDEPLVAGRDRAVLELAHPAVGQRHQIVHPVRHRACRPCSGRRPARPGDSWCGRRRGFARIRSWRAGSAPTAARSRRSASDRLPNTISTNSSKQNSQYGSRSVPGRSTCALSSKQPAYSLCGSISSTRRSICAAMISRRISATPLDLPAPVEPKMAKCFCTISSTST